MTLFDILKDINYTKSYLLHKDESFEKEYNDFMVNRYLSMSPETVFESNFMNKYSSIPKLAKYLFLSDVIEKKDRFLKYIKSDKDSEDNKMLSYIQEFYYVGKDEAKMLLETITEEEKKFIKKCYEDAKKCVKKR